jgi:hypothetical protein
VPSPQKESGAKFFIPRFQTAQSIRTTPEGDS